jgi:hypothetical protein
MKARLRPALAALIMAAICAGCAHDANEVAASGDACAIALQSRTATIVDVPFELVNGRIYLEAHVNGQGPFRFAVDTGASDLARADATLVAALALDVTGHAETSDNVNTTTVDTVHFDTLSLGGLTRENFEVITRDYGSNISAEARFAGIIARDFFNDGLLVIDFPARRLYFTRAPGIGADAAGALSYERPFRVPVTIGDLATTGNLDTGASVTLVLPRTLYDEVGGGPLEPAGRGRLTNTVIDTYRGVLPGPVRVGGVSLSNVEARVAERYPELMIGGEVLRNYIVAIDQRTRAVAICAPTA